MLAASSDKVIPSLSIVTVVFDDFSGLIETSKSISEHVIGEFELPVSIEN